MKCPLKASRKRFQSTTVLMSDHLLCAKFYDVITFAVILYISDILGIPEPKPKFADT